MADTDLLQQFVSSFRAFDEMCTKRELTPTTWELRVNEPDEFGWYEWRPTDTRTDPSLLEPIYSKVPAHFPRLYEQLVLSYRWDVIYLDTFSLLQNPPGRDLSGLLGAMSRDRAIWDALIPAGYIQFGRGPDMDYDPVCFEIKSRTQEGDYRIVKIDHEEILCNDRLKIVAELAPSFESLMRQTIRNAASGKQ